MNQPKKEKELKKKTYQNEDPLSGLYQIDTDAKIPLEEEAIIIMVKMLDNLEEFKVLRDNLRNIMTQDEQIEMRMLSLLKVLITGVQTEYLTMGYLT
jgi:hypothetical protein